MKRYLILLFALINSANLFAQKKTGIETSNYCYYGIVAFNYNEYYGADINFNYVSSKNYTFNIGHNYQWKMAKNIPIDYREEYCNDIFETYQFLIGKRFSLTKTSKINLLFGLGYTLIKKPIKYTEYYSSCFWCVGPHYYVKFNSSESISYIINPRYEFIDNKLEGIIIDSSLRITKEETVLTFGIGIMVGRVE